MIAETLKLSTNKSTCLPPPLNYKQRNLHFMGCDGVSDAHWQNQMTHFNTEGHSDLHLATEVSPLLASFEDAVIHLLLLPQ